MHDGAFPWVKARAFDNAYMDRAAGYARMGVSGLDEWRDEGPMLPVLYLPTRDLLTDR
ncbi:hypothetical protein LCGC14_2334520 [marine sediment metagenome]|uniref:Uncharacterized protein n=1 Tax=marine sediment metagenome TaxID=412755 RepID=A0A0F9D1B5_9ZZZZ